jgi:hypothetical protein
MNDTDTSVNSYQIYYQILFRSDRNDDGINSIFYLEMEKSPQL